MVAIHAATTSANASATTPPPRLIAAAHEFEAQMMKELLQPMTGQNGLDGENDDSATGSGGALGEFASEALGRALSNGGGFGMAHQILSELSHTGNQNVTGKVPGNAHGNTVMSGSE